MMIGPNVKKEYQNGAIVPIQQLKTKTITTADEDKLDTRISDFLSLYNIEVVSIQLQVTAIPNEAIYHSAMIVYYADYKQG